MKYFFFFLALLGWLGSVHAEQNPEVYFYSKKANQALVLKQFQQAQNLNLKAIQKSPFDSDLYLNLGLSFEGQELFEAAQKSYLSALKYAKREQQKFVALFNLGQMSGKQKNIDQALEFYQKALEINPDSRETKVNIELLIQQGGQGGGEGEQKEDPKESDQKDENQDSKDSEQKPQEESKPKEYKKNQKYQMQPFESKELNEQDVKKIFEELKQQEQRIRQEFNKDEKPKENSNGKDW